MLCAKVGVSFQKIAIVKKLYSFTYNIQVIKFPHWVIIDRPSSNLGVMDYYRMKNIEADTQMRESIAKPADGSKKKPDKIG